MKDLQFWMTKAINLAQAAAKHNEVPVGAIIINQKNQIIAQAENRMERDLDPTAHAEIIAIRSACQKLQQKYLQNLTLIVTLEPCSLCATAISLARLERLVFGSYDIKSGGVENGARIFSHSTTHHKPQIIGGIMESENKKILQKFFASKR